MRMMATGAGRGISRGQDASGAGQFITCVTQRTGMVGYIAAGIKNVRDTCGG